MKEVDLWTGILIAHNFNMENFAKRKVKYMPLELYNNLDMSSLAFVEDPPPTSSVFLSSGQRLPTSATLLPPTGGTSSVGPSLPLAIGYQKSRAGLEVTVSMVK